MQQRADVKGAGAPGRLLPHVKATAASKAVNFLRKDVAARGIQLATGSTCTHTHTHRDHLNTPVLHQKRLIHRLTARIALFSLERRAPADISVVDKLPACACVCVFLASCTGFSWNHEALKSIRTDGVATQNNTQWGYTVCANSPNNVMGGGVSQVVADGH